MQKKVSLKPIVSAIEEALKQLDPAPPKVDPKADPKIVLKGLREAVMGLCAPDFEIPG